MVRGGAVFGGSDTGEDTGTGVRGRTSIVREYVRNKKEQLDEKATVRFETMPGCKVR
jgi:hypothetical protein